jgi:hypothetical protein
MKFPLFPATAAATSARYSFSWVLKAPHIFPLPPLSRRFHSTHILDITPGKVVDGLSHLHESLDNARDAPMRRVPPAPLHSEWEASRARSEIAQELVLQEDILIALNKFNDRHYTARDQGFTRPHSTNPSQHPPRLSEREQSGREFWVVSCTARSCVQGSWFNQKELITNRVYLTRAPLKDLNPCTLHRKIEKSKEQRRRQA